MLQDPRRLDFVLALVIVHNFFFGSLASAQSPRFSSRERAQAVTASFDESHLNTFLREFTGDLDADVQGQKVRISERGTQVGRQTAVRFLVERFSKMGFETQALEFSAGKLKGANVEAILRGEDNSLPELIISAHLDSVSNAGANDDGSGIATLMAVAQVVADLNRSGTRPLRTIRLVAFDLEEKGLLGSKAYVASLKKSGVKMVHNIQADMVGNTSTSSGQIRLDDCGDSSSVGITRRIVKVMTENELPLRRAPPDVRNLCPRNSDHASFWEAKYPAVFVHQVGLESCYHGSCDTVSNINFQFLHQVARLISMSVLDLAY